MRESVRSNYVRKIYAYLGELSLFFFSSSSCLRTSQINILWIKRSRDRKNIFFKQKIVDSSSTCRIFEAPVCETLIIYCRMKF